MAAVTLNTGPSDAAYLAWAAGTVTPPTLGQNFLAVFAFPAWTSQTADRRIFAIPAASGDSTDVYGTLILQWTNAGADALQIILQDSTGTALAFQSLVFDGVASATPALVLIRGTANGSDTDIEVHAEVYGQTADSFTDTLTGSPLSPTTDGHWGWGNIATYGGAFTDMPDYVGTAIRGVTALAPVFCAYASAGAVPTVAATVALLKANIGNLLVPSTFGSFSAMTVPGFAFTQGNAGGSFDNYSIGTDITASVNNVLAVRNAAGSSNNLTRYAAQVSGTHRVVDPFAIADYVPLSVTDPVSGPPTTGTGLSTKLRRYRDGTIARLHSCIVGQSWAGGQASSPLESIASGLGAGNDFTQGYIAQQRASIVGIRLQAPLQNASATATQQRYRLGLTTQDDNGIEQTYTSNASSASADPDNYEDWQQWGVQSSGPYASGSVASNGGLPMVGSYTESTDAEFQCGFDLSPFPRIGVGDGVTVEVFVIGFGGGPNEIVPYGARRPDDDIHGSAASDAGTVTGTAIDANTGEGTARDLVSVGNAANVATIVFSGAEADIDADEVDDAEADHEDPDIPRWVAYITDTVTGKVWLMPIRTAAWSSGSSEWTITCTPGFHYLPTNASTTKVRCSRWTLIRGYAQNVTGASGNTIRSIRVKKIGASGGGVMVAPVVGWMHETASGEVVSSMCAGSYAYHSWDTINVPGLFARLMQAANPDLVRMMNTAVPIGVGNYAAAIERFERFGEVIGVYIPAFHTSYTSAAPLYDASSRTEFRQAFAAAGRPYFDLVVAGGHVADRTLRWGFQDPTHLSALGYYEMADLLAEEERSIAIASNSSSGLRRRTRTRTRGKLPH